MTFGRGGGGEGRVGDKFPQCIFANFEIARVKRIQNFQKSQV